MCFLTSLLLSVFLLGQDVAAQGAVTSEPQTTKPPPTNGCLDTKRKEVESCINQLRTGLVSKKTTDVNNFLCDATSATQKERLDCVIKYFRECKEVVPAEFLTMLRHVGAQFYAEDLFHLRSADEFCECAKTHHCLSELDFNQMAQELDLKHEYPWKHIANPEYICGRGLSNIDCVGRSLPVCTQYLQHKHNRTVQDAKVKVAWVNVADLEYAHTFAKKRCKIWPEDNHRCTEKRVRWHSLAGCTDLAQNFKDEEERKCGMRRCIEIYMSTCPPGDMDYFIDAINVFSKNKIKDTTCSSAIATIATVAAVCTPLLMSMVFRYA